MRIEALQGDGDLFLPCIPGLLGTRACVLIQQVLAIDQLLSRVGGTCALAPALLRFLDIFARESASDVHSYSHAQVPGAPD